jgi:DNA modification methylase
MAKRSPSKELAIFRQERYRHSSENFSDLKQCLLSNKIEHRPIGSLRYPIRLLRRHSRRKLAALRRSIVEFQIFVPLLIDGAGNVLSGVARLLCATELGFTTVPVIVVLHLTETQKRLFAVADNRIPELSSWDLPELKLEMKDLSLNLDLDLSITGFDTPEIDRIVGVPYDVDDANDVIPDSDARAISRPGDLFCLGRHKVYCGSALDLTSYNNLLGLERVQMAITDPPYNLRIAGHVRHASTAHREFLQGSGELSEQGFTREFLAPFLECVKEVTADGAIIYVFIDHAHSLELQVAAYPLFGKQKNLCVWVKDNAGMGSFYRAQHELVYVFKKGAAPHINNFNLGEKGRFRSNVWNYPGANSGYDRREALAIHPTVKPCAMFVDAMLDCSHRGGIVLDCFGGSGTAVIAAERTGRRARVIELDPLYVDLIVRRWQSASGKVAVHAESGLSFEKMTLDRTGDR